MANQLGSQPRAQRQRNCVSRTRTQDVLRQHSRTKARRHEQVLGRQENRLDVSPHQHGEEQVQRHSCQRNTYKQQPKVAGPKILRHHTPNERRKNTPSRWWKSKPRTGNHKNILELPELQTKYTQAQTPVKRAYTTAFRPPTKLVRARDRRHLRFASAHRDPRSRGPREPRPTPASSQTCIQGYLPQNQLVSRTKSPNPLAINLLPGQPRTGHHSGRSVE
mmetsp:Transcript_9582/g.15687  ORF Transcript_9582/g.15687 Transcript_9582/m.15687 type:complete len:220 (+) Transcript_9582:2345-3004(+)